MTIKLKKEFGEDFISRAAGERLRKIIVVANKKVTVDFEKQIIASVSFLDEAFAKLILEGWSHEQIEKTITFKNIHSKDLELIRKLIKDHIRETQ